MKMPNQDKIKHEMYEAAAKTRNGTRGYLGMSEIGKPCDRQLWLSFRGYSHLPLDGRMIMLFDLGDQIEQRTIHWLTLAGYKIEGQQEGFTAHFGLFRGHCDGVIHGVTQKPHILEIKSASDKRFKSFKSFGVQVVEPTYYCQAQCYMGYANIDRTLFVIINKNTSEIYTERLYFYQDAFDALHRRAYDIITSNNVPPMAFDEDSIECKWCDYKMHCRYPKEAMQTQKTCGTCLHLDMNEKTPFCVYYGVTIAQWGVACEDWMFRSVHVHEQTDEVPF